MKELENLLNSLIDRGWKPWGIDPENIELFNLNIDRKNIHIWYMDYDTPEEEKYEQEFKTFRELVSMESWLWDFVAKNKLYDDTEFNKIVDYMWEGCDRQSPEYWINDPSYRLVKSALILEQELAKFLVDNIKLWK